MCTALEDDHSMLIVCLWKERNDYGFGDNKKSMLGLKFSMLIPSFLGLWPKLCCFLYFLLEEVLAIFLLTS